MHFFSWRPLGLGSRQAPGSSTAGQVRRNRQWCDLLVLENCIAGTPDSTRKKFGVQGNSLLHGESRIGAISELLRPQISYPRRVPTIEDVNTVESGPLQSNPGRALSTYPLILHLNSRNISGSGDV